MESPIGIAKGACTDVAMESAGVTLVEGDSNGIARVRRLSRAVGASGRVERMKRRVQEKSFADPGRAGTGVRP